jgi:hypothetical protein
LVIRLSAVNEDGGGAGEARSKCADEPQPHYLCGSSQAYWSQWSGGLALVRPKEEMMLSVAIKCPLPLCLVTASDTKPRAKKGPTCLDRAGLPESLLAQEASHEGGWERHIQTPGVQAEGAGETLNGHNY